jgi:hypothetical protein
MAERGRRGDITIDVHAVDLLRAAFVLPSRFVEDLRERGVPIGDGEATGVATRRTLEQEAVRLQIPPEDIRDVVRMATGRIVKMEGYPELFPPGSDIKIVRDKTVARQGSDRRESEARDFYRLSTINVEPAETRLRTYEELLPEDIEEYRRSLIQGKERTTDKVVPVLDESSIQDVVIDEEVEVAPIVEVEPPSVGTVRLIAPFDTSDFDKRVEVLKSSGDEKNVVEPIGIEMHPQPVTGVFFKTDLNRIVVDGISSDEFSSFIQSSRALLIQRLNGVEDHINELADEVLVRVEGNMVQPGRHVDMPVFVIRDLAPLVAGAIQEKNTNENVDVISEMPVSEKVEGESIARSLVHNWVRRFDSTNLENSMTDISEKEPALGEAVEYLLLDDNSDELVKKIRAGETVVVGGQSIGREQLDKVLGEIYLTDEVIAKALFADVVATSYRMPYLLKGEDQEAAFVKLKFLAEQFNLMEIQRMLTPQSSISGMWEEIKSVQAQIKSVNDAIYFLGTRLESNLELSRQRRNLVELRERLTRQADSRETVGQTIDKTLRSKVPTKPPRRQEFSGGVNSEEFQKASKLYDAWMAVSPDGYKHLSERELKRMNSGANIRSILYPEGFEADT